MGLVLDREILAGGDLLFVGAGVHTLKQFGNEGE